MIRIGLCSITFRALGVERIVALAADTGLESIEWGGDVHVPPGDVVTARRVARVTADAGLISCSYGSYFRAGVEEDFAPVLDAASALGVDRIRVWAGRIGSADADDTHRAGVTDRLRAAAAAASERGVSLALEFHGRTLADTPAATLRLLADVDHPALFTYWQPTVGAADDEAVDEYRALADRVSAAHVFSWWPHTERLRLSERTPLWQSFFTAAFTMPTPPKDALLEFVLGDNPAVLAREVRALRSFRDAGFATLGSTP